jgi:hypothetical protein
MVTTAKPAPSRALRSLSMSRYLPVPSRNTSFDFSVVEHASSIHEWTSPQDRCCAGPCSGEATAKKLGILKSANRTK